MTAVMISRPASPERKKKKSKNTNRTERRVHAARRKTVEPSHSRHVPILFLSSSPSRRLCLVTLFLRENPLVWEMHVNLPPPLAGCILFATLPLLAVGNQLAGEGVCYIHDGPGYLKAPRSNQGLTFHGLGVTYHRHISLSCKALSGVTYGRLHVGKDFQCSSTLDRLLGRGQFPDAGKGVPPPKFQFQSGVAPPIPAPRFTPPLPSNNSSQSHLFPAFTLPCRPFITTTLVSSRLVSSRLVCSPVVGVPCLIGTSAFPGCLFLPRCGVLMRGGEEDNRLENCRTRRDGKSGEKKRNKRNQLTFSISWPPLSSTGRQACKPHPTPATYGRWGAHGPVKSRPLLLPKRSRPPLAFD
ncbi:hypothetical protein B0T18DRAFT_127409 [Schizothecium vesticola]|uniref:Uncharacterized protein n=1 Tax=Schizothecium vesticola TaxID=314040 RepID=A0AA40K8X2_9PEZI|nr:hypothetical protein B0T18DRAFT_127409 [Schizothecium vesticola]